MVFLLMLVTAVPTEAAITFRGAAQNGIDTVPPSAITHVGAGTPASMTGCGDINPSIPGGNAGDLLIAQVVTKETDGGNAIDMPNWNLYYSDFDDGGGDDDQELQIYIFWRVATGGDPDTVTQSGGFCNSVGAQISRFRGVDTSAPFQTGTPGVVQQNSGDLDTGTITTTSATAMLLVGGFIADDRNVTQAGGWNESYDFTYNDSGNEPDFGLSLHYQAQTTAGNKSISNWDLSQGGSDENFGVIYALTPAASTAGLTINVPAGTTTDDVMVASISVRPSTIAITPPAGWTSLNRVDQTGGNSNSQEIFYRVATGSEPASYTWTFSGAIGGAAGGIVSYTGVDTSAPIDAFGGNATADGTTHTANSITTTVANTMLVSTHSFASAETWTAPAGMTERVDVPSIAAPQAGGISLEMNDETLTATGATGNRTATAAGNTDTGVAQLVALTPASISSACDFNSGLASGIPGDYYNNMTLTDPPAGTRVDGPVDFDWGTGSPGIAGVGTDNFSERWEGSLRVTSTDTYRFQTESDDGVRLWIDGNLVIDNWTDHAPTTDTSADIALSAGQLYDVRLEHYENGGGAVIRLRWGRSSGGFSYSPIPAGPEPSFGEGLYHCPVVSVPDPQAEFRMDEASWDGTVGEVVDETGNGFDGTSQNGADTDDVNPAIGGDPGTCGYGDFDGTDDYVEVSGLSGILNDTASMAFWINTSQVGSDTQWQAPGVTGVEESGGADDIFWGWIDASGNIGISVGDDIDEEQKSTSAINDGTWHHVVLTRDAGSGETKVYVDGNLESTGTTGTGTIGNGFTSIGRIEDTGGSPEYFDGLLDEVRVYDVILDDDQVTTIMNATHPCPSAANRMEVDSVTLNDTTATTAFTSVTFNQTYNTPPLVFVLPTNEGPDPSSIRISNVTTTGFQMSQVEPPNLDGPHPAMTVHYLAIDEGTLTLPDGTIVEAGTISTTTLQHGSGVAGTEGWETVTFTNSFGGAPAILSQIQTMNNETGNPPTTASVPWLVATVQNVTAGDMEIALERNEAGAGTVSANETIGYVAIEGNIQGSFVSGSDTILYETIISANNIQGWDNQNCASGGGQAVPFVNSYSNTPLVIAYQNTHNGGDGGWLRRCNLSTVQVNLAVDEDTANDGERNHTSETAGVYVFSQAFCLPACDIAVIDRYEISHDGSGVTCLSEEITITAIDTDGNTVDPGNVTIDLSVAPITGDSVVPPAKGDWVRVTSGTGTLSNRNNNGTADYQFPGDGTSSVTLVFNYTRFEAGNTTETINFNVDDTTNGITDTRDSDPGTDPDLTFSATGLQFYNVTDNNTTVPVQIGGKPSNEAPNAAVIALRAVRSSDDDPTVCESAFPAMSTVSIPLGAECLDPAACGGQQMEITNNGNTAAIATNADNSAAGTSAYTGVNLLFEDGGGGLTQAFLILNYPDVGEMQLHGRYEIPLDEGGTPPTGAGSGGFMIGSTNPFVVRPFGIAFTNIQAGATSNPGSLTPGGTLFTSAGTDFSVTVGAYLWQDADDDGAPWGTADDGIPDFRTSGDVVEGVNLTDNGLASSFAWDLTLTPVLYEPTPGGSPGALNNNTVTAAEFSGGQATISDLQYLEAGTIGLLTTINNYLGITDQVTGRSSYNGTVSNTGAVGRFGADHFTFTMNTPALGPACGNFTYVDQPFDYTTQPQITARAMAADGTTVLTNYEDYSGSGGDNWWLLDRSPVAGGGGIDVSYTDLAGPADIQLDTAVSTYSPNSGTTGTNGQQLFTLSGPFAYAKQPAPVTEQAPFDGDLRLDFGVSDSDGASGTLTVNPVNFNNPEQRWGRMVIINANGSELLDLAMPVITEYWDGTGYVRNTDDSCTVIEDLADDIILTNPATAGGTPQPGDTVMTLGGGTTQITSGSINVASGSDALTFSAPGAGNTGYVDVEINLSVDGGSGGSDDPWLQYDRDGDGDYNENPAGRASFGIYSGSDDVIYIREPWN